MRTIWADLLRVLTFRASPRDCERFGRGHLIFGLVLTWLVGIGRRWDDPRATLLQHLGLGSVAYVFVLAFLLWVFALGVSPTPGPYRRTLIYVTLTAPPGLLYALPVERWTDMPTAQAINFWFLAVVAAWRVALYFTYLKRCGSLGWYTTACTVFLPMALIVTGLAMLNLDHVVFSLMAGADHPPSPHDTAYGMLVGLSMFSWLGLPLFGLGWILARVRQGRREEGGRSAQGTRDKGQGSDAEP